MIPAIIILCNGIDSSLSDLNLEPFKFTKVSANDPIEIETRQLDYTYKARCNPDGTLKELHKESIKVDTLYDLVQHLFPPYSSARTSYLQIEQYWDGKQYQYKEEPERFACFFSNSENEWEQDMLCLLDTIRLFKLNRAGFGLCIHTRGGIGLNDLYKHDTNKNLWANPPKGLPIFSLDGKERDDFQKFYSFYREWFLKENPEEKDQVIKKLIDLYRLSFNVAESSTALILLSQIWELFAQYFPDWKENGGENKAQSKNKSLSESRKRGVSFKIKNFVSIMVRNDPGTKSDTEDNLYKIIGYLYKQRCILVHQETGDEFDPTCIPVAFDVSRCLILKLIYAEDDEMKTIVSKIDGCGIEDVPYPDNRVKLNHINQDLLKKMFKSTSARTYPHA